jgi:hypothetical protein
MVKGIWSLSQTLLPAIFYFCDLEQFVRKHIQLSSQLADNHHTIKKLLQERLAKSRFGIFIILVESSKFVDILLDFKKLQMNRRSLIFDK